MQFKTLSLVALSATGAVAQIPGLPTGSAASSVLSVLQTAIPSSVISQAIFSPSAFISEVAASIAQGQTPSWYAALPTDVKSALPSLFPIGTPAVTTEATSTATTTATETSVSVSVSVSVSLNSTSITSVRTPSLSRTPTSAGASATSSSSTGGASYPTAVVGAGIAGALGVIGMLAL